MQFECLSCEEIYLESPDLPSEAPRTVIGICEPCGRLRLGDDHYDLAIERAIASAERSSRPETRRNPSSRPTGLP